MVGTASLGLFGKKQDNNWTVYTVFVEPKYNKLGIGSMLMSKVESYAKEKNIDKLSVPASITSLDFYKKLGYIEVEYIEKPKIHLMKKSL